MKNSGLILKYLQHISFNLMSDNPEILIIPIPQLVLFTRKKKNFISDTCKSQGHVQKGLQESQYTKHCISWPPVFYSINSFSYETPENTEDNLKTADEGYIQMEYYSD